MDSLQGSVNGRVAAVAMSELGQSRRFGIPSITSGLPPVNGRRQDQFENEGGQAEADQRCSRLAGSGGVGLDGNVRGSAPGTRDTHAL